MNTSRRFTLTEFERIPWRRNKMKLQSYVGVAWNCSECGFSNLFDDRLVALEGGGMRIVVTCLSCGQASVLKAKGIFKPKLEVEASLPSELRQPSLPSEWSRCGVCSGAASPVTMLQNMLLADIRDVRDFQSRYGPRCLMHATAQADEIARERHLTDYDVSVARIKAYKSNELAPIEAANRILGLGIDESFDPRAS